MTRYEIEFKDDEGDILESVFDNIKEAKEFIKELKNDHCKVIQTWKYVDNNYKGSF